MKTSTEEDANKAVDQAMAGIEPRMICDDAQVYLGDDGRVVLMIGCSCCDETRAALVMDSQVAREVATDLLDACSGTAS